MNNEASAKASGLGALDFTSLRAEALEDWLPYMFGNRFASILALKGEPGEAERRGQPFFGADSQALESALVALGWETNSWCGIALTLANQETMHAEELRLLIETIDPSALLALDNLAIEALQESYGIDLMPRIPKPGAKTMLLGRSLVFVDGFEAALASYKEEAKRRVWQELKALKA
ncbi:MAG: hypothetical protein FWD27_06055 [Coriobacteriia bacterium]|nr:hypothetical protein [Coriobacteriia bacterium]